MPVGPCRFDQCRPGAAVTSLCDPTLASCVARGALRWHQAEERHELTWMVEPAKVTCFSNDCRRRQEADATHGLECLNHGATRGGGQLLTRALGSFYRSACPL